MPLLDVALDCVRRGWHVFPCWPGRKEPRIKGGNLSASNDEAKIRAWWAKWPDANVAISTKPSRLTIVDCDHGNQSEADFHAWRESAGLPETYTVRTGRRDGFGVQMYYSTPGEDPATSMAWDEETHSGDIRGSWGYVMAAGCVHPSGDTYSVLVDAPIAPVPGWARTVKKAIPKGKDGKPNTAWMDDGSDITDHRNCQMISLLGRKRGQGADDDSLREYALEVNEDRFKPPLDESELEYLIRQACKFPVGEPDPVVIIGGKANAPEPKAPVDWRTHYHTFDEMDTAPPTSFLIDGFLPEDAITALAAPVGQRKSLIALNVAHAVCTAEPLFDYFKVSKQPSRVLYLCPEMGLRSFTDRLRKIGLLPYVGRTLFCRTMSAGATLELDELTAEELAGAVVVIDTAVRYLKGDENSSEDMRVFAEAVFRLMRDGASSVLLLHHSAKGTKESGELSLENSMRGSGELGAFVSSCWATRLQNPAEPYQSASYLTNVKQRDFESQPFEITSGEDCRLHIVGKPGEVTLKTRNSANKDGKADAAEGIIRDHLDLSVRKLEELLNAAGIKRGKDWILKAKARLMPGGVTAHPG